MTSTGIAGHPREWLPRFTADAVPVTPQDRFRLVTQPASQETYDAAADAAYIREILASRTTGNGVFGIVIHWLVLQDAVRRLRAFLDVKESSPHRVLSSAFPNLSYVWLKRRDKVAQAVSWYKAIQTGSYVGRHANGGAEDDERLQFDYGKIRYLLSALSSFENAWGSFFTSHGLTPLVLYYEDLSANHQSTIRSVLDFLRLDTEGVDIPRPTREKYADARSLAWVEQFKRMHTRTRSMQLS